MRRTTEEKKLHENYFEKSFSKQIVRYRWIRDHFLIGTSGQRILEIGCGDGGVIQLLNHESHVTGLDISRNAVHFLRKRGIPARLVDLSNDAIPYPDGTFDIVMAFEVVEHLKSPHRALEEIQRVCKKGGKVLLSTPNPRTGHKFLYRTLFDYRAFERYLLDCGFAVEQTRPYGFCPPFWSFLRGYFRASLRDEMKTETDSIPLSTKIVRFLSSDFITLIKPRRYSWLLVYDLINIDPKGAKKLYEAIAAETSETYK